MSGMGMGRGREEAEAKEEQVALALLAWGEMDGDEVPQADDDMAEWSP